MLRCFPPVQVKDRLKMHKQLEEDRISGAANKPSAEDEFDSRVRESEVRTRSARAASTPHSTLDTVTAIVWSKRAREDGMYLPRERAPTLDFFLFQLFTGLRRIAAYHIYTSG